MPAHLAIQFSQGWNRVERAAGSRRVDATVGRVYSIPRSR